MGRRSTSSRNSARIEVLSKPGLNYGHPNKKLYVAARKQVLEHLDVHQGTEKVARVSSRYHFLHGKAYDLRSFAKLHPGGADIIQMTAGVVDATPIFESYHAFADRADILERLEQYLVPEDEVKGEIPDPIYSFEEGGFYDTVTKRVRKYFGATTDSLDESLTKNTKANAEWYAIVGVQFALNLVFYLLAFVVRLPMPIAMVCAFLAGMFQIQWGFTAMHDASHFGLASGGSRMNDIIMRVWCSWSLWNGQVWSEHHVVRHHGFTGSPELDPDIVHGLPMVRKHPDTDPTKENGFVRALGDRFGMPGWIAGAIWFYVFAPGMWLGQAAVYARYMLSGENKKRGMWGLRPYNQLKGFKVTWWEHAIYGLQILMQIQRLNPLVTYTYFVALNIFYSVCIVADHDLVESAILNHVDVAVPHDGEAGEPDAEPTSDGRVRKPDWGEVQVRNTTNFCNDEFHIFAALHGSINYQIEHHLFPGVNHVHLPKIAHIVRDTCEEFGVPYVTYPRLWEAWYSFVMVMRAVMTGKDSKEDIKKLKSL